MDQKDDAPQPSVPEAEMPPETPASPSARRRRRLPRWFVYPLAILTAVLAALIVTVFAIDLGPFVREEAEKRGSAWLDRPMTIGRVSARLTPGVFEFEDLVIQGLTPDDRPFLKADKITVSLPWWTIFNARADRRGHRADRLGDGHRELPRRAAQLSARDRTAA